LYEKGRFKEAKDALMYLGRENGVDVRILNDNQFDREVIVQE